MKILLKIYVVITIGIIISPVLIVLFYSFIDPLELVNNFTLSWYNNIFSNVKYTSGWMNSIFVAIVSSFLSTVLAFFFGFFWGEDKYKRIIVALIILLAIFPPEIHAMSIKYFVKYIIGFDKSTLVSLIYAHSSSILPYTILLIVFSISLIKKSVIRSSYDLGADEVQTYLKVIYPLIKPGLYSSVLLGFIISFNEYSRVYYLKGGNRLISEIIYGAMKSSNDPSIYALASINIFLLLAALLFIQLFILRMRNRILANE